MHQVAGTINIARKKLQVVLFPSRKTKLGMMCLAGVFYVTTEKLEFQIISFTEGFAHPEQGYSFKILMKNW